MASSIGRTFLSHLISRRLLSTAAASQSRHRTRKVAEIIVRVVAFDPAGERHQLVGLVGKTLLRALVNGGLIHPDAHRHDDIYACSAECEMRVAPEWLSKLPPPSEEEMEVLKFFAMPGEPDKHARLSCQIRLKRELDGIVVALPEPRPWDIP